MKTISQVKTYYKSKAIDGRDLARLSQFMSLEQLKDFGLKLKEEAVSTWEPIEFTRENVLKQLEKDLEFGFEKALNKRGLSAGAMYEVVKMWNWILEEGLEDFAFDYSNYPMYGLPLFKTTAIKYNFKNPIGNDTGKEQKYES